MSWGRGLTCPEGIASRAWPISQMQDVEAYVSCDSCAASICWHQVAQSCGMQESYYSLFSQAWDAQRSATYLRGEVVLSANELTAPLSMSKSSPPHVVRRSKQKRSVQFGPAIELHIFEDFDQQVAPAISFGVDALQQWEDKPWTIHKKLGRSDTQTKLMKDNTYVQPHVIDRWCVASSGHPQEAKSWLSEKVIHHVKILTIFQ